MLATVATYIFDVKIPRQKRLEPIGADLADTVL